ncbi:DUF2971 domain-containing protein [Vibrio metoecus]|uniref:DUF2971 domain-containing protein n=1 Tax=Vibrio metoecus TaxID=1481663 RepID=UPI0001B99C7C|nr:DUF2971 domain-containing protein [Vibrio metoecus]EEX67223.1 hypothetical protein VCJ_000571 [Vibrio metoecus]
MKWKEVEAKFRVDEIDSSIQRTLQKQVGICSLTTKACNLLMWAHYAKNHTGLVFEFSNTIPKDMQEQSKYLCAMHVDYMECKPVIDMLDANYVHSFLVKGQDWQYEDEIRCLNLDGAGIYKYLPELLESVILGAKISEKDEKEIKLIISRLNKVRKKPMALYKARLIKDKFKLYIPQHPVYGDMNWT